MNDTVEKIGYYAIGGICGLALGFLLLSIDFPLYDSFDPEDTNFFLTIALILGMLISASILLYKKEKLYISNKKIRDETVALITHEMRTGLTETGWAIEATLENYRGILKEADEKMLTDVIRSINTTVMHTVNLLDISLLDIGKLVISLKWVKLSEVEQTFIDVLRKYTITALKSGITLNQNVMLSKNTQVEVDMLRLRIALENLLENSIQYTFGETRIIDVDIHNDATSLYISVTDTGMGIPVAEQKNIFSEFFRATNARRKISTGSGIGLHMCYQYIKAHHGTITFKSKESSGTTFNITLPLKTAADVNEFLMKI